MRAKKQGAPRERGLVLGLLLAAMFILALVDFFLLSVALSYTQSWAETAIFLGLLVIVVVLGLCLGFKHLNVKGENLSNTVSLGGPVGLLGLIAGSLLALPPHPRDFLDGERFTKVLSDLTPWQGSFWLSGVVAATIGLVSTARVRSWPPADAEVAPVASETGGTAEAGPQTESDGEQQLKY